MRSWVGQVARPSRVAAANGALLEVTLQNVTPGERIIAENTHVWSVTSV